MRLGGAGGIGVRVNPGWFALTALVTVLLAMRYFPLSIPGHAARVYWVLGAAGALVLFLSIVAHEIAHVLVARRFGVSSHSISLDMLGGRAEVSKGLPSAGPESLMALAGPAANSLLALMAALALETTEGLVAREATGLIRFTALINGLLAAVNLLPVLPLDGGRLLRAFIWSITDSLPRATHLAARIGSAFAISIIVLGALAALGGFRFFGLLAAAIGLYLLRRGAPYLRLSSSVLPP